MRKITIVQQIPKTQEQLSNRQTRKTTYPYVHRTVDSLSMTEDAVKLLKTGNAEAMEQLRISLVVRGHEKGVYNIREVLGGCKRFRRSGGFLRIGIIEI